MREGVRTERFGWKQKLEKEGGSLEVTRVKKGHSLRPGPTGALGIWLGKGHSPGPQYPPYNTRSPQKSLVGVLAMIGGFREGSFLEF